MQDNMLPKEYTTLMQQHALNACPVSPYPEVELTVQEQLHAPIAQLFDGFETAPLASASLAQVHRAKLKDGTHVAVKVQHRRLKDTAPIDLAVIRYAVAAL